MGDEKKKEKGKAAQEEKEDEKLDQQDKEEEEEEGGKKQEEGTEPTEVFLHRLPLLSTVDHYTRLTNNTPGKRVVGALLGHNVDGKVHVTNSFAVPFEEDAKNNAVWFLDHHYLEDMFGMFKKVNAKEAIVGWYSTGPKLKGNDMEIHQLLRDYCTHPVYIIIRVMEDNSSEGIPCTAYKACEQIANQVSGPQMTFQHLKTTLKCSAMEEVGVVHLLRDIQDYTVSSLSTQVKAKVNGLRAISNKLQEIKDYMEAVVEGKIPISHAIMYEVQDIFNTLPSLHLIRQSASLATEVNDQTMVTYLGTLLRSVVALHNLILNKFEMKRLKEEDAARKEEKKKKKEEEEAKNKEKEVKDEKMEDK